MGGRPPSFQVMESFRAFTDNAGLFDLGFKGPPYTWSNRQGLSTHILERLDRALVTDNLLSLWPLMHLTHLSDLGSDHRIILLQLIPGVGKGKPSFHFDHRWCQNNDAHAIVLGEWQVSMQGTPQFQLFSLCKAVRHRLVEWARMGTTNSARQIRELRSAIESERDTFPVNWEVIQVLETQLAAAYLQEEAYWKQKSRTNCLQVGDANTNHFHRATTQRRRQNFIEALQDEAGTRHYDEAAKGNISIRFFEKLFSSNGIPPYFLRECFGNPPEDYSCSEFLPGCSYYT
ncbi:unnamed protein product [Linum trigynum]|uniref:Endonuclease/exonuclease/phosphatase domain-containing protein n=1 Tax=Linum trigynum TaxID=586398 RepID=A0AAV2GA95_9ROSI